MDTDLRASLVAAGAAFALSSLVGLFSRVGFGAILGRALVIGLLFGALAFGAMYLLRAFSMDAGARAAEAREADLASPGESGRNVDIVLDEEGPVGFEDPVTADDGPGRPHDRFAEAENPELAHQAAEGPRHLPAALAEGLDGDSLGPEDLGSLLEEEETETAASVPYPSFSATGGRKDGFDDLDVLPDLEGFSDSFAAPEYKASGSSRAESGGTSGGRSSGLGDGDAASLGGREGLDPASLAKAVRTILKRDQKG